MQKKGKQKQFSFPATTEHRAVVTTMELQLCPAFIHLFRRHDAGVRNMESASSHNPGWTFMIAVGVSIESAGSRTRQRQAAPKLKCRT